MKRTRLKIALTAAVPNQVPPGVKLTREEVLELRRARQHRPRKARPSRG